MSESVVTFYLFRHGQTDWNVDKRIQGHTNICLNAKGREEARILAHNLSLIPLEVVYCSDLDRAIETGQAVSKSLNVPLIKTELLREAHFGEAEGLLYTEAEQRFGEDLWKSFRSTDLSLLDIGFPGGETKRQSVSRILVLLQSIIDEKQFVTVGVSTHGGVIKNLLHFLGAEQIKHVPIPNCVTYILQYSSAKWNIEGPVKFSPTVT
ncbi:MAG: histidine phosphatase family protein [Bdellovibrio sp.]|nr:histidine phosphatase family protein [Bdellovibrio sp.]